MCARRCSLDKISEFAEREERKTFPPRETENEKLLFFTNNLSSSARAVERERGGEKSNNCFISDNNSLSSR